MSSYYDTSSSDGSLDIYDEILEQEEAGGETFTYIPCLNIRDDHIAALLGIIENELQGWL